MHANWGCAGKLVNGSSRRPAHPGVIIARSSRQPEAAWFTNSISGGAETPAEKLIKNNDPAGIFQLQLYINFLKEKSYL